MINMSSAGVGQVVHPAGWSGVVKVSIKDNSLVSPLQYKVVTRPLIVQSLGLHVTGPTAFT
jgi:hypothetical protein